jgi:hypothetical protein
MTSIEDRLARDIAAVTRGIVVTDSELLEARKALDERIDVKRRQSRHRMVAAVAAAAAVVAVGGVIAAQALDDDSGKAEPANTPTAPAAPSEFADFLTGEAPTNALLDGVWRLDNGLLSFRFAGDGTVWISDQGKVFGHPAVTATYDVDGYDITFTTTEAPDPACVGQQFVVPASIAQPGTLHYASTKSAACAPLPVGLQTL